MNNKLPNTATQRFLRNFTGRCYTTTRACYAARQWVGKRSIAKAWRECENMHWMTWLVFHIGPDRACAALPRDLCTCDQIRAVYSEQQIVDWAKARGYTPRVVSGDKSIENYW